MKKKHVFRVCILGESGVGKTVYIASLQYIMMKGGSENVTFTFDKDKGGEVIDNVNNITEGTTKFLERIVSQLVDDRKYPAGTTQTIELFFQINYGKEIYDVKVLDYPGEQAKETHGEKDDEISDTPTFDKQVDSFFSHHQKADAFVFLINPFYFIEGNVKYGERTAYFQRIIEALKIIRKKNKGQFRKCPVAFVLTQADRFSEHIDTAEEFVKQEMAQVINEAKRIGAMKILHISSTGSTTEKENSGNIPPHPIKPENVAEPFHFIFRTFKKLRTQKRQFKVRMTFLAIFLIITGIIGWDILDYNYTQRAMDREIPWPKEAGALEAIKETANKRYDKLEKFIDSHSWKKFCVSKPFIQKKQIEYFKEAGNRLKAAYPNFLIMQYNYWVEMNQKFPGSISSNILMEAQTKARNAENEYQNLCEKCVFIPEVNLQSEINRIKNELQSFDSKDQEVESKVTKANDNLDNVFEVYNEYISKKNHYKTFDDRKNNLNRLKPQKNKNSILQPVFIFREFIAYENDNIVNEQKMLDKQVGELNGLVMRRDDNSVEIEKLSLKILTGIYPENEAAILKVKRIHEDIKAKMSGSKELLEDIDTTYRTKKYSETIDLCKKFIDTFPEKPECQNIRQKLKEAEKFVALECDNYNKLMQELEKNNLTVNCTNWISKINKFLNNDYVDSEHQKILEQKRENILENDDRQNGLYSKAVNCDKSESENLPVRFKNWKTLRDNYPEGEYIEECNNQIQEIEKKMTDEANDFRKLMQELEKGNRTANCTSWINEINNFLNRGYVTPEHSKEIKIQRAEINENKTKQDILYNSAGNYDNSEPGNYQARLDKWRKLRDEWGKGEYINECNKKIKKITDEWQFNQVENIEKTYNNGEYSKTITKADTFIKDWEEDPLTPEERLKKVKYLITNAKSGLEAKYWNETLVSIKTALNNQEKIKIVERYEIKCQKYSLIVDNKANKLKREFREKSAGEQWTETTGKLNTAGDVQKQYENIKNILEYKYSPSSFYKYANPKILTACKKQLDDCRTKFVNKFKEKCNKDRCDFKFKEIDESCKDVLEYANSKTCNMYILDDQRREEIIFLVNNYHNWYRRWDNLPPKGNDEKEYKVIITKLQISYEEWNKPKICFDLYNNNGFKEKVKTDSKEIWTGEFSYDLDMSEFGINLWGDYKTSNKDLGVINVIPSLEKKQSDEKFNKFPGEKTFYVWPYGFGTDDNNGTVKFVRKEKPGVCKIIFRIEPEINPPPKF